MSGDEVTLDPGRALVLTMGVPVREGRRGLGTHGLGSGRQRQGRREGRGCEPRPPRGGSKAGGWKRPEGLPPDPSPASTPVSDFRPWPVRERISDGEAAQWGAPSQPPRTLIHPWVRGGDSPALLGTPSGRSHRPLGSAPSSFFAPPGAPPISSEFVWGGACEVLGTRGIRGRTGALVHREASVSAVSDMAGCPGLPGFLEEGLPEPLRRWVAGPPLGAVRSPAHVPSLPAALGSPALASEGHNAFIPLKSAFPSSVRQLCW